MKEEMESKVRKYKSRAEKAEVDRDELLARAVQAEEALQIAQNEIQYLTNQRDAAEAQLKQQRY